MFAGDIVNVSAWKDMDKEGSRYREYFINADSYWITNYKAEARGFQGIDNEIFLDLTAPLPSKLYERFDLAFNHTVLEHIYKVNAAFENLCRLSKDIVIVVVPFLQEMHAAYGDYWRFSPSAMKRMFEDNDMKMIYCSFNSHPNASVYLFCIGSKKPGHWKGKIPFKTSYEDPYPSPNGFDNWVGCHAITNVNGLFSRLLRWLKPK